MKTGKVWLVGAGPSDGGLFTIKGKMVLETADVVIYDQLVGDSILCMIPPAAEKIDVGKQAGFHKMNQEDINELLLKKAQEGLCVVRLKGGDPFLFGRGGEELELLKAHKVPFEIIPGITSPIAVPAYAGIPVTHRDYTPSLHIITGHRRRGSDEEPDYDKLAALGDVTLVFLMSIGALSSICEGLMKAGMDENTPAAVLEKGTTARQRRVVSTLKDLPGQAAKADIGTPGIIIVGRVCTLSEKFHWAEDRPLGGARVFLTRPADKSSRLAGKLMLLGAEVIELPSIVTIPLRENKNFDRAFEEVSSCQWMVFTSDTGVKSFFSHLRERRIDIRAIGSAKVAAVGPATQKALEERGLMADYVPKTYNGNALAKGLASLLDKDSRVLVFAPDNMESSVFASLKALGVRCTLVGLYRTEYADHEPFTIYPEDFVTFTSASCVDGFANSMKDLDFTKVRAVCIGQQTAARALDYGMKINVSQEATINSLVEEVIRLHKYERASVK